MNQKDNLSLYDHIILNEHAYFYRKGTYKANKNVVDSLFKTVLGSLEDKVIFTVVKRKKEDITDSVTAYCSLLIYKATSFPTFFDFANDSFPRKLNEEKISYLLIVEIEDYVVLLKKNIARLASFIDDLEAIDGKVLSGILVTSDTAFQKLKLTNMNMNEDAVRNKMYEANHLENSMPMFSADQSIVQSVRMTNQRETCLLNTSTSKIAKFGSKKNIHSLLIWIADIVKKLNTYSPSPSFLSHFAVPIKWKDKSKDLKPITIIINLFELHNYIENALSDKSIYRETRQGMVDKSLLYSWLSKKGSVCFKLDEKANKESKDYVCHELKDNLLVRKNKSGIKLYLKNALATFYCKKDEEYIPLVDIINTMSYFSVGFEDYSYIYYGKRLYQNAKILAQKSSILYVFEVFEVLNNVTSEKGSLTQECTEFSTDSIFYFVDDFFKDSEILVCDDLGNEWADHIAIKNNSISFIHSKYKQESSFSASNLQDVIGQALKNIGNLFPDDETLKNKTEKFSKCVGETNISRCRKGDYKDFATKFREVCSNPNAVKEVCLAINFISKKELTEALVNLENDTGFKQKHSVIQMLWLLNGFISICKERDLHCRIFCRP